jgi:hypothetical protein
MVIELVLLFAFAVAIGVAVVKVIKWRLDVLYGPYLGRDQLKRRQNDTQIVVRVGSRQDGPSICLRSFFCCVWYCRYLCRRDNSQHACGIRVGAQRHELAKYRDPSRVSETAQAEPITAS